MAVNEKKIIKLIERIEANAHRLLDDAAALKAELSGGSGSSKSQVFSPQQQQQIIDRRLKYALKEDTTIKKS